jgi:hypothetical protein
MKATNRTETDDIQDLFAIARRLADVHAQPPPPLRIHRADRQRDGPRKGHGPFMGPGRATGAHGTAQSPSGTRRGVWTTFGGN